jgi:hypothetical protein
MVWTVGFGAYVRGLRLILGVDAESSQIQSGWRETARDSNDGECATVSKVAPSAIFHCFGSPVILTGRGI